MNMSLALLPCFSCRRTSAGLLLLLLVLLALSTACVPSYETRLRTYRDQGNLVAAEQLLDQAQRLDPGGLDIVRERGIIALERGAADEAVPLLEQVLRAAPDDDRAAFYLALANDELGRWETATVRYRRYRALTDQLPVDLHVALVRQQRAVTVRHSDQRLERALAGTEPPPQRILFLPFDLQRPTPLGRALRLGLVAILIEDWESMPARAAVPLAAVQASLAAMGIESDSPIDEPTRERLARLTGASHVVYGRISEMGGSIRLEPSIADRQSTEGEPVVTRIEYLHGRTGTLLDLEKTILFRTARVLEVDLTPDRIENLRAFATQSPLALQLFGESLWLIDAQREAEARERVARAILQDPDFAMVQELRLVLDPAAPLAVAGDIDLLRGLYEHHVRRARQAELQASMLAATGEQVGLLGGPAGEQADLSVNRPAAAGSASILIQLPR